MSIDDLGAETINPEDIVHEAIPVERQSFQIPEWLKAPTGEGKIEDYIDHPMNFNNSKPVAQVLRGLTGMFNNLNYAAIDVVLGIMKMKKPVAKPQQGSL